MSCVHKKNVTWVIIDTVLNNLKVITQMVTLRIVIGTNISLKAYLITMVIRRNK